MAPGGPNAFARASKRVSMFVVPKASALMKRVHGITWQAFPAGLGTATVYILLSGLKTHPDFLTKIEVFFFILNILIFSGNLFLITAQAFVFPKQAWKSIRDPARNTFIPTFALNFATILVGIATYGPAVGLSADEMHVFFWMYIGIALIFSIGVIVPWFWIARDPLKGFSPAWAFPVFPLLLTGVVTFNALKVIPLTDPRAVNVLLTGIIMFGAGAWMSLLYLAVFLARLMTTGFMDGHQANGAFVAAGPPGFAGLIIMNLCKQAATILPANNLVSANVGEIWVAGSIFIGLTLTGFSAILFIMAVIPYYFRIHKHLDEILGCWAATFPNIGLILSLRFLGDTFNSGVLYTFQTVLTIFVLAAYAIIMSLFVLAWFRGLVLNSSDKDVYAESVGLANASALPGAKSDEEKGHGHGH